MAANWPTIASYTDLSPFIRQTIIHPNADISNEPTTNKWGKMNLKRSFSAILFFYWCVKPSSVELKKPITSIIMATSTYGITHLAFRIHYDVEKRGTLNQIIRVYETVICTIYLPDVFTSQNAKGSTLVVINQVWFHSSCVVRDSIF